jgi:hypothetical protein
MYEKCDFTCSIRHFDAHISLFSTVFISDENLRSTQKQDEVKVNKVQN